MAESQNVQQALDNSRVLNRGDLTFFNGGTLPTQGPTQPPSGCGNTVAAGSGGSLTDAQGNKWTITAGGQVAKNGVADTTTSNVNLIAYVNNQLWQEVSHL
jgi:hypothetical protein